MDHLRAREGKCECRRLTGRLKVDVLEWHRAARLLVKLGAEAQAISCFTQLTPMCASAEDTACVVYMCVQYGGCTDGLCDKALRRWLCRRAPCTAAAFSEAQTRFFHASGGYDPRCWGPSEFEFVQLFRSCIPKNDFVRLARRCIIDSQQWSVRPASLRAENALIDASTPPAAKAGNLVSLLLKEASNDDAESGHRRVRPVPGYEVEHIKRMKRDQVGSE